jgi:hypothetical protein
MGYYDSSNNLLFSRARYRLCKKITGGWDRSQEVASFFQQYRTYRTEDECVIGAQSFLKEVSDSSVAVEYEENHTAATHRRHQGEGPPNYERKVVIVLDEAVVLTKLGQDEPLSKFRALRRAATNIGVVLIVTDTSSKLTNFNPVRDNSARPTQRRPPKGQVGRRLPPFFVFPTFDLRLDRQSHAFLYGRPLWAAMKKHRKLSDEELVMFAQQKLSGSTSMMTVPSKDERRSLEEPDRARALRFAQACFACRFGMGAVTKNGSELVASHMATLTGTGLAENLVECTYLSEPVLVEASARSNPLHYLDVIDDSFTEASLSPPRGDRGEMMAAAALCFHKDDEVRKMGNRKVKPVRDDQVDINIFVTSPMSLKDMLTSMSMDLEAVQIDDRAFVNFTHFTRVYSSPVDQSVLEMLWTTHAACYCPENYEAADLIIPVKIENEYRGVKIQVKNYESPLSKETVQKLAASMLRQSDCHMMNFAIVFATGPGSFGEGVSRFGELLPKRITRTATPESTQYYIALDWRIFEQTLEHWSATLRKICSVETACESSVIMRLGREYLSRPSQQTEN